MYLLDTNVVSELRRRETAHPRVLAWAGSVDATDLWISAITVLEIEQGALLAARRDPEKGRTFHDWLHEQVLTAFKGRVLAVDTAVALQCAALHVPDPKSERDALIGATASVHRLRVVTRNTADFRRMGVDLVNPWDSNPPS